MFQGDKKFGQSILYVPEEALKRVLLPWVPKRVETYHLTLMTVPWCGFILLFSYFARFNIAWLWGVSAMIAAQYVTDLLDGAIGRQRNTGLVKWGFYMDHFLDFVFLCTLLIGYAILLPQMHRTAVFFVMALFSGFMVNSFLAFSATNRFQIAYMGIGPTEIRLVFILINTLIIIFGIRPLIAALPYTLAGAAFGLFFTVYRTQQELWRIDMAAKHAAHAAAPAPHATRHRRSFVAALVLAVVGIWLATLPVREVSLRLASLTLLSVAAGLLAASLLDLRRLRRRRRFFLTAFLLHLPYTVVGLLLLAGLRVWFVLAPMGTDFPPVRPDTLDIPAPHKAFALYSDPFDKYPRHQEELLAVEDRYRGFINIDPLSEPAAHADAFTLFFAAYTSRCVMDMHMLGVVLAHPGEIHAWDTFYHGEPTRILRAAASDATVIRLVAGALYLRLHRGRATPGSPLLPLIDENLAFLSARLPKAFKDAILFRLGLT